MSCACRCVCVGVGNGVDFVVLFLYLFLWFCLFPCAWVGPVDLLLYDLIIYRYHPVRGALLYFNVNAERFDFKKKKKRFIPASTLLR